jgi:hypothetical protein
MTLGGCTNAERNRVQQSKLHYVWLWNMLDSMFVSGLLPLFFACANITVDLHPL